MASRDQRTARRPVVVITSAAALLALLAVVVVSSGGEGNAGELELPNPGYLLLGIVEVAVVVGLVALVLIRPVPLAQRPRGRRGAGLVGLLLALAIGLALDRVRDEPPEAPPSRSAESTDDGSGSTDAVDPAETPPPERSVSGGDLALVILAIAAGTVVAAVAVGRRRAAPVADETMDDVAAEMSDVLDDAVDALRAEADTRRAVIAAYGRMEQTLAHHRMARRPSEAPLEYLARALRRLDAAAEPSRRLTDLFEEAMFSNHPLPETAKEEAIDALLAVRDDLRARHPQSADAHPAEAL